MNRLYFATLWRSDDTYFKIIRHQERRDNHWILGESVGDVEKDKNYIIELINKEDSINYCMIDGLINWCIYCSKENKLYLNEATRLATMIIDLINTHDDIYWYLLDNEKSDYSNVPILGRAWEIIHSKLTNEINNIQVIKWRRKNANNLD